MSIVYFSEKALENIASREKLDNSEKACYDLALRKDCCKRIYFPKSKSSYHDHLTTPWKALDIENLPDSLQYEHMQLHDNTDFKKVFCDFTPNIYFIDDVMNHHKNDKDDNIRLFIIDDIEKDLEKHLISQGYQVESISSLIDKDLTKITAEVTTKGNWEWVRGKVNPSNKRVIWIDKFLDDNILFQSLTKGFISLIKHSIEDAGEGFQSITDDKVSQFICGIKKIKFDDVSSCINSIDGKRKWKFVGHINALRKQFCIFRDDEGKIVGNFLYTQEQRNKVINVFLLQEAKLLLSKKVYPTLFKNLNSEEVFNIDVLYMEKNSGVSGQFDMKINTKEIIKLAFQEMLKEFNIKSNISVKSMGHLSGVRTSDFADRYIITNNYIIKAKLKPNLCLQPDITITHIHFNSQSEYIDLCKKTRIDL